MLENILEGVIVSRVESQKEINSWKSLDYAFQCLVNPGPIF